MYVDEFDIRQKIFEVADKSIVQNYENLQTDNLSEKNLRNNFNIIELSKNVKLYFEPLAKKFI